MKTLYAGLLIGFISLSASAIENLEQDERSRLLDAPGLDPKAGAIVVDDIPRVRIFLKLVPHRKVVTRLQNGQMDIKYVAEKPIERVLRAKQLRANHFYVSDWHIETVPQAYNKKTQQYTTRFSIYQRFGTNLLEEKLGSLDLTGLVTRGKPTAIGSLEGQARTTFKDRNGNPILEIFLGNPNAVRMPNVATGR